MEKLPLNSYTQNVQTKNKTLNNIKAAAGTVAGVGIPLALMMKKRKIKNPLKMDYGLQDMLILSGSSVAGGLAAGIIGENKHTRIHKLKEGVFQFLNASVPTVIVGGLIKLCESSKKVNNIPCKVGAIAFGLLFGMLGAAEVSNLIFDPKDKEPDRKLTLKDGIINADDAIGALVLARFPIVDKLHVDKLLPVIYAYCGTRAGNAKE